jgi:hypothetical protein
VTYGYEAPTGYSASQPEWLDPGTGQWIAGESYTLKGIVPGPIRVALRVTRDDGTRVGTVKVVEIVG